MSELEEKKNHRLGIISSIGIHVAMLLLFFFVMGWTAPNPPLGEVGSGIELNFGLDDQGGGDIQPEVPPGAVESTAPEKKVEEAQIPQEEKVKAEQKPEETKVETPLTSEEESPVTVKESRKEAKVTREVKEKPAEVKPMEQLAESKKEEKKVVKEPDARKGAEEKKGTPGPSQGDDKGKAGDKGNPQGTLDAKSLYGKPGTGGDGDGGGGGGGISVSGFAGFERPTIAKPEIPNESYGTYSFKVKVNRDGQVISIIPISKGISLEAERIFKRTIENTEFISKETNLTADSEGTITFRVVAPPAK